MAVRLARLVAILLVAAACAPTGERPGVAEPGTVNLVWPDPPARPRIRFVRTIARPADLGVTPSFWQRVGQVITGGQEEWLIRPTSVAVRGGTLYVADPGAQALWVIDGERGRFRKIDQAGGERLISPVAVAVGPDGSVYLADSFLARVFVYGAADLAFEGTIGGSELLRPAGLAVDAARRRLYVADSKAHRVWIFALNGQPIGAVGERGTGDGQFNFPTYLTVDGAGRLHVVDSLGFRVQVFDPGGGFLRQFGHHGDSSGDFASPKGIALDSQGHVYVVDALFDAVQIFDAQGRLLLGFGDRGVRAGQFWLPAAAFIDPQDRIYVADAFNQRIQVFQYLAGGGDD